MISISLAELVSIIFYIVLIILIIVLIVFAIKAMKTLNKVDKVIDDINVKSSQLNGVFNIIDTATDVVSNFSDSIVGVVSKGMDKMFSRRKGDKHE